MLLYFLLIKEVINGNISGITYVAAQDNPELQAFALKHPEIKVTSHWDDSFLQPDQIVVFDVRYFNFEINVS